ncbi:FAD:protein FMN transferase [Motiliproteus sediminis]|uniref:FAD:protein FMN transferase n=1 Tax=Motiliproteus sediminis TaxID=1468178 RepID=UPI0031BB4A27
MTHHLNRLARLLAFVAAAWALAGCMNGEPELAVHTLSGTTMGTTYSVKVVASQDLDLRATRQQVQAVLDRINQRMSTYRDDSELSRFNRAEANQWFAVSDETARVVALGLTISEQTQGAFDMTVGPLVNLWGFGPNGVISKAPSQQQIDELRGRIGYQSISVRSEPPALLKTADQYLDLSAIAKGYAVDAVADLLAPEFSAYLVEVGGELRAHGIKPDGQPWRIAVESPLAGTRGDVQEVIRASETAIATSGDYRNYFEQDGVRYSHTIDPATAKPITHRLASVTVLDPSCARADALATAMMVLGDERGRRLAEAMDLAVLFIVKTDEGFAEYATEAFKPFLIQ